jgi:hypothetical protein
MQSAMWVILGGTVALAALLDRHQHQQTRVALAQPLQCGAIQLQLPARWMIEYSDPGIVTASESGTFPLRRLLEVTVAPPAEPGLVDQLLQKQNPGVPQPVSFGSAGAQTGKLYHWQESVDDDAQAHSYVQGRVIATTVLPNGPEITLRLEHLEGSEQAIESDDDIDLVRRIAATVRFQASP